MTLSFRLSPRKGAFLGKKLKTLLGLGFGLDLRGLFIHLKPVV